MAENVGIGEVENRCKWD